MFFLQFSLIYLNKYNNIKFIIYISPELQFRCKIGIHEKILIIKFYYDVIYIFINYSSSLGNNI